MLTVLLTKIGKTPHLVTNMMYTHEICFIFVTHVLFYVLFLCFGSSQYPSYIITEETTKKYVQHYLMLEVILS